MDLSACGAGKVKRGKWKVERGACGALVEDGEFKGSSFGSQFPL